MNAVGDPSQKKVLQQTIPDTFQDFHHYQTVFLTWVSTSALAPPADILALIVLFALIYSAVAEQINFDLDEIARRLYHFLAKEKKFGMIEKSDVQVRHTYPRHIIT